MEAITDSVGCRHIFTVAHYDNWFWLDGRYCDDGPYCYVDYRFVFLRPRPPVPTAA